MKKLIIVLLLAGFASTLQAAWKYNPFTSRLDYYGDIGLYSSYDSTNYEVDFSTSVNIAGKFISSGTVKMYTDLQNDEVIEIIHGNTTGKEDIPFILIDDNRTGTTKSNEDTEATLVIDATSNYAFHVKNGHSKFGGITYYTNALSLESGGYLRMKRVIGGQYYFYWNLVQDDGVQMALGGAINENESNRNLIFTDYVNVAKDHDHDTVSSDPTLFVHSRQDPDIDNTQWYSMTYSSDSDRVEFDTGGGHFEFGKAIRTSSFTITNQYTLPTTTGADNEILKFNGTTLGWEADATAAGGGDNFGSHIATQTVDMAGFGVINIASFTSAGAIEFMPSGDTDDYLQFYTSGNQAIIKAIGIAGLQIESDHASAAILKLHRSTGRTLSWGQKDTEEGYIIATDSFTIATTNDLDDTISIWTSGNEPYIGTAGGCNLNIRADGGTINFDDELLTIAEGALADASVIGADLKDDTVDSADYAANSLDREHLAGDIDPGTDFAVTISTPHALGTVATLISPFRNYAVTITTISASTIGGTNVVLMVEQRTIAGINSAGTDIWGGDLTAVPTLWTGLAASDFTVPAGSALVLVPTSVSGDVDRIFIKGRFTVD